VTVAEPTEPPYLRLIVTGLMLISLLGATASAYFLYRGEAWALKPTASLAALTVFLMTAKMTASHTVANA
jgi:hypothetical protein